MSARPKPGAKVTIGLVHSHLAHTGLRPVDDVRAAYRLFLAERAMREGASARDVLEALHLDVRDADVFEKYSPDQPRVPKGSGRISGQWTRVLSWLGGLSSAELAALGSYALRVLTPVGGAVAAFGLLFIPSPNDVHVEGEVSGVPGLRYSGNSDEALFHFSYDTGDGEQRTFAAYVDGDKFRDEEGRIIGRVLPDGGILIESAVASPDLVKDDEPRLCPIPGPDKQNALGREYAELCETLCQSAAEHDSFGHGLSTSESARRRKARLLR